MLRIDAHRAWVDRTGRAGALPHARRRRPGGQFSLHPGDGAGHAPQL